MTEVYADSQLTPVTAVTRRSARSVARRYATRVTALAQRLPVVRLFRMAEVLAARIQLGIGGVALMMVAQLVGDLVPTRRR